MFKLFKTPSFILSRDAEEESMPLSGVEGR